MPFLNRGKDDAVLVGAGSDFQPSGLIGQWSSRILWSFWTETDPGNLTADGMSPSFFRKMGRGYRLYYPSQADAKNAAKAAGVEINPQQMWHFECPKTSLLNVPEKDLTNFGDVVSFEVEVATEKSKKLRYKMHFVALPKSVQSYAKLNKWDVPEFPLDDLTRRTLDAEGNEVDPHNDELFKKLCGDPDSAKFDPECVYFKQRTALWAALGEPDPRKWHGKYVYDAQGKRAGLVEGDTLSTVSDKLDEALGLVIAPWSAWARMVSVKDPRPDAVYGDENKRLTIPTVWEFFTDEAQARKVATDELKAREERKAGKTTQPSVDDNKPPLPEVWAKDEAGFIICIKQYAGKPLPLAAKDLMVEVGELAAWKEYLKL